jgi:hypothetical protein
MFKIIAFFIITLFSGLYVRHFTLMLKHLHDRLISLWGEVCVHKTTLTPRLCTELPVPSQESEQSCMCVLGVLILHIATILRVGIKVFNATFRNISVISWRSVLLLEETREDYRHAASRWQTSSHKIVSSIARQKRNSDSQL